MYFDMSKYIYSESLFNPIFIEIKKKYLPDKINVTKNALIFLSWPPIHCNITFNS